MKPINDTVASNLKLIREQKNLSLDMLAKITGVSKSLLAQIERGEANPTITTVWKIANGLKISFTQLVSRDEKDCETVELSAVPVLSEDGGRYRNYPIFPYDDSRKFEIYYIELDPGAFLQAAAHPEGTQEFIIVFAGEVEICVNDEHLLANGERAVRFKADCPHSYKNLGDEICRLSMTISY
jgi:transcriptional regulator with XRE-family HTH domain